MQTEEKHDYSGVDFLAKIEAALQRYNRWIVKTIVQAAANNGRPARVLDFGAGTGTLSVIFASLTGIKPEGVELDPVLVRTMEDRGFVVHSSIAATNQSYDLIFTSNVLEHIPDDERTLRELRTKLSENGMLAVYVPALRLLWSSMDDSVGHYRRYTKKDLEQKLENSGFIVTSVRYCDSAGFFVTLLFKIIGSGQREPSVAALSFFDRYILPVSKVLDVVTHPFFGKNVVAFAKPDPQKV